MAQTVAVPKFPARQKRQADWLRVFRFDPARGAWMSDPGVGRLEQDIQERYIEFRKWASAQDMASFSAFMRKSPPMRLRHFLVQRGVHADGDSDWSCDGRGAAFVRSIEALIAGLPDAQQDALKTELALLAELASDDGMSGVAHVCAGEGVDLEGCEGVEDHLLLQR